MRNGVRGQSRPFLGTGLITAEGGVIVPDPAGRPKVMTFSELATALGSSGGGLSGDFYMSPLCAPGDATTGELIFAPDGDVVMVPVPF